MAMLNVMEHILTIGHPSATQRIFQEFLEGLFTFLQSCLSAGFCLPESIYKNKEIFSESHRTGTDRNSPQIF